MTLNQSHTATMSVNAPRAPGEPSHGSESSFSPLGCSYLTRALLQLHSRETWELRRGGCRRPPACLSACCRRRWFTSDQRRQRQQRSGGQLRQTQTDRQRSSGCHHRSHFRVSTLRLFNTDSGLSHTNSPPSPQTLQQHKQGEITHCVIKTT